MLFLAPLICSWPLFQVPASEPAPTPAPTSALARPAGELVLGLVTTINEEMASQGLVGMAASIVVDGEVHSFCTGFEDREAEIAVTPKTLFRWASISKPVTAIAAMQLVEQGKLDLDADVRTLVPEFPKKPWGVTARQLMQHRGGIVHYWNGKVLPTKGVDYGRAHPFADAILALDKFKDSPLIAEPGTQHAYSTHGYMLLGAAVQRAGAAPFHHQVTARISAPLDMKTLYPDYQWEALEHRAVGYRKRGDEIVRSADADVSWKLPGGGYVSTIGDLARFAKGIAEEKLLTQASWTAMWTPQQAPETEDGFIKYGFGFGISQTGGELRVSHTGAQAKTRTLMQVRPGTDAAVVLMTNCEWAKLAPIATKLWAVIDGGEE